MLLRGSFVIIEIPALLWKVIRDKQTCNGTKNAPLLLPYIHCISHFRIQDIHITFFLLITTMTFRGRSSVHTCPIEHIYMCSGGLPLNVDTDQHGVTPHS